jgi:hypothetical protein
MVLEVDQTEATEIVRKDDEVALQKVDDLFKNLILIDGVPEEGNERLQMTPAAIARLIQETNLTRFETPTAAVFIDHLGMCRPGDNAPRSAKDDENSLAGYLMEEFFSVCKETKTFFVVLQQLPKEVKPGTEFSYDSGRGGSRQTDFSDYIFCLWRPEQNAENDDEERLAVEGQYKIKIGKNRHGMSKTAHCTFDWHSLNIEESENLTPHMMGGSNVHPVETIVDNKGLIDELIEETHGDASGMGETKKENVPSWFDK